MRVRILVYVQGLLVGGGLEIGFAADGGRELVVGVEGERGHLDLVGGVGLAGLLLGEGEGGVVGLGVVLVDGALVGGFELVGGLEDFALVGGLPRVLLEVEPVGPVLVVGLQHELGDDPQLLAVLEAEPADVLVQQVVVQPLVLVPVAVVLALEEPALQEDHAHAPHVVLVGVGEDGAGVEGLALLGGQVDALGVAVVVDDVEVGGGGRGQGVGDLDESVVVEEDVLGVEGFVLELVLLEGAHAEDEAGQDRPEFLLLEPALLQGPLVELGAEAALRVLPHGIDLVDIGAQVVDGLALHSCIGTGLLPRCVRCSDWTDCRRWSSPRCFL